MASLLHGSRELDGSTHNDEHILFKPDSIDSKPACVSCTVPVPGFFPCQLPNGHVSRTERKEKFIKIVRVGNLQYQPLQLFCVINRVFNGLTDSLYVEDS